MVPNGCRSASHCICVPGCMFPLSRHPQRVDKRSTHLSLAKILSHGHTWMRGRLGTIVFYSGWHCMWSDIISQGPITVRILWLAISCFLLLRTSHPKLSGLNHLPCTISHLPWVRSLGKMQLLSAHDLMKLMSRCPSAAASPSRAWTSSSFAQVAVGGLNSPLPCWLSATGHCLPLEATLPCFPPDPLPTREAEIFKGVT